MTEDDRDLLQWSDVLIALRLLTRMPVPSDSDPERRSDAAWAYPIAGLIVGLAGAIVASLALWISLTPHLAAALAVAAMIVATGAMHEDGLADSADGLWGGWDSERRLEIMKDSRIGTYGVLALGLSLVLRITALGALFSAGHVFGPIIVAAALSRAGMPAIMTMLEPARTDGLSVSTGRPQTRSAWIAVGLSGAFALVLAGGPGIMAGLAAALASWVTALIANRKIGGQTGDILGGAQQLSEIAALLALSAVLT